MDIETAGQYFSQENPVIREITERVQRMYFMFSFILCKQAENGSCLHFFSMPISCLLLPNIPLGKLFFRL